MYGIEVAERELTPEEERRNDDRESMMVVSSYAAEYFAKTLHETPEGQNIGIAYFRERGFFRRYDPCLRTRLLPRRR